MARRLDSRQRDSPQVARHADPMIAAALDVMELDDDRAALAVYLRDNNYRTPEACLANEDRIIQDCNEGRLAVKLGQAFTFIVALKDLKSSVWYGVEAFAKWLLAGGPFGRRPGTSGDADDAHPSGVDPGGVPLGDDPPRGGAGKSAASAPGSGSATASPASSTASSGGAADDDADSVSSEPPRTGRELPAEHALALASRAGARLRTAHVASPAPSAASGGEADDEEDSALSETTHLLKAKLA